MPMAFRAASCAPWPRRSHRRKGRRATPSWRRPTRSLARCAWCARRCGCRARRPPRRSHRRRSGSIRGKCWARCWTIPLTGLMRWSARARSAAGTSRPASGAGKVCATSELPDVGPSPTLRMPGSIRPARAKLLQMGAQIEEQVPPLFLAAASVRRAVLRDQLRQLPIDALVDASPCLQHGVARYPERFGDGRIGFVEQRALENSALRCGEVDPRLLRREQLEQAADHRRLDPFPAHREEIRKLVVRHARERDWRSLPKVMQEPESAAFHVTGGLLAIVLDHDRPDAIAAVEEVEGRRAGIENLSG